MLSRTYIFLFAVCLFSCASGVDDFEDEQEFATLKEGISAKFSATRSYGVSSNARRTACTRTAAGGSGFKCRLPPTTAIRYKIDSNAPVPFPLSEKDWRSEARRGIQDALLVNGGANIPFTATEVTDNSHNVFVTTGTCSGDAYTSDNIQTLVCSSWVSDTQVTESLPGNYHRWAGVVTMKFDLAKIQIRANKPWVDEPGCDSDEDAVPDENYHQLLEHGAHAVGGQIIGLGTRDDEFESWLTYVVVSSHRNGQGCYDTHAYTTADLCRGKSFAIGNNSIFEQGSPLAPVCQ